MEGRERERKKRRRGREREKEKKRRRRNRVTGPGGEASREAGKLGRWNWEGAQPPRVY